MTKLGVMRSVTVNGQALQALRESRGLNQEDLAELLAQDLGRRFHVSSISKYENGKRSPKAPTFDALCRVLKATGKKKQSLLKAAA